MLRVNPRLSRSDLSKTLNIKEDTIQYNLNQLKKVGRIIRRGPDKGGYWEVVD